MGSYPTYEEWKPKDTLEFIEYEEGSYPTYEEWKPSTVYNDEFNPSMGSYPTYEEWKHIWL